MSLARGKTVETLIRTARMRSFSASDWPSGILPGFIYPWFLLRLIFRIKISKNKLATFYRIGLHSFFGCLAHASNTNLQAVCIAEDSKPSTHTWEQTKLSPVVFIRSHRQTQHKSFDGICLGPSEERIAAFIKVSDPSWRL